MASNTMGNMATEMMRSGKGSGKYSGIQSLLNIRGAFKDAQRILQYKEQQEAARLASQERTAGINAGYIQPNIQPNGGMTYQNADPNSTVGGMNIYHVDPITGEYTLKGTAPKGSKVYKGVLTPEQMRERGQVQGEVKAEQKDIEATAKLASAVKRLSILNKQYKEAFPSGDKTPFEQRISGGVASWAAKKGLYNNPQFLALQKNIRPIAINMVRMFGEVGNLSESEQQGAIDVVNQAGLTDKERIASTKQFIEFALAGAGPSGIKYLKNNRRDIQGMLDAFGVDLDSLGGETSGQQDDPLGIR